MSTGREMREQFAPSAPERSGVLTTLLVGIVAFAIGAAAIVVWKRVAASSAPAGAALTEAAAPRFAGNRLGRAEQAPLLRTCIKFDLPNGMSPDMLYTFITTAGTVGRIAPALGVKELDTRGQLTEFWKMIAECVYQQNSWHLCDRDNRALAVAATSAFIRDAAHVAAPPIVRLRADQMSPGDGPRATQRVLDALRMRVRNGQLIAADFGWLAPPEIKAVLNETRTVANACDKP
jgi:hypothetical protein